VFGAVAQAAHFGRPGRAVAELHATPQIFDLLAGQKRGGLHLVGLGHLVIGVGDALGEVRVVGEQQ